MEKGRDNTGITKNEYYDVLSTEDCFGTTNSEMFTKADTILVEDNFLTPEQIQKEFERLKGTRNNES